MEEVEAAVQNLSSSFGIEISSGSCANVGVLHAIDLEALDIYNTFVLGSQESKDKFEHVMKKFEEHFIPKCNIMYKRHCFFMRNQMQGETIDQYVTELHTLEDV